MWIWEYWVFEYVIGGKVRFREKWWNWLLEVGWGEEVGNYSYYMKRKIIEGFYVLVVFYLKCENIGIWSYGVYLENLGKDVFLRDLGKKI